MSRFTVSGIGVGVPGFVKSGFVWADNLEFDNYNLKKALEDKLSLPVYIDNDANCAAMGEKIAGAGKGYDNMLMVTLGTGIGGGIIIDGKIYRGRANAGEIGHISIDPNGEKCPFCGGRGCWEKYASVGALVKKANAAAKENPDSLLAKKIKEAGECNGKIIFEAEEEGCEVAGELVDYFYDRISMGIKSLGFIFDPEIIVLGGAVSKRGDKLLEPLAKLLPSNIKIATSMLGNNAGIIGAANIRKMTK